MNRCANLILSASASSTASEAIRRCTTSSIFSLSKRCARKPRRKLPIRTTAKRPARNRRRPRPPNRKRRQRRRGGSAGFGTAEASGLFLQGHDALADPAFPLGARAEPPDRRQGHLCRVRHVLERR